MAEIAIKLFGREIVRGARLAFRATVSELNDGTPVTVPVLVVAGREPGPVVVLTGCIHGDEFGGPIAIQRIVASVAPEDAKGVVIGIPVVGPFAYFARARSNVLDYEHFNLNRLWPGEEGGFASQRALERVFEEAVCKANFVLDYHEGGVAFLAKYLLIGGSEATIAKVGAAQVQLCRWFGLGVPIAYRVTGDALVRVGKLGNLIEAAGAAGIPAISVELGGGGTVRPEFLDLAVRGTRRVLAGVGVLAGGPPAEDPGQVLVRDTTWARPRRGGLLIPTDAAVLGARIAAGTRLAAVVDALGETVDEIVAPHDSVIFDIRLFASVYPGDWAYHLGKL